MASNRVTLTSRLEELAAEAIRKAEAQVAASAARIASDMRASVPKDTGATASSIRVERQGAAEHAVVADFPWRQLEFGTVKMPARPFAWPATQRESDRFNAAMRDLYG